MDDAPSTPGGRPVGRTDVRHVPAGGISVWAEPDPSLAPITELPSGFELRIVGRRGGWMHVQADDGLDGWVDGTQLAGVAVGAAPVPDPVAAAESSRTVAPRPGTVVVEKRPSSFLLGTGPVIGTIGGMVAILGTKLAWVQSIGTLNERDAFQLPWRVLQGWDEVHKGGFKLGLLIVVIAGIGALVSLISGGGIVRRILGGVIVMIAVVYVLQTQDLITSNGRGLGTGLNVWDVVDYGAVVTFGGGLLMVFAPSR